MSQHVFRGRGSTNTLGVMTVTGSRSRAPHLGPERRRPQLLDAARAVAIRDGIGSVTIGAVAHESGIARSVLYRCFADRIEMVEELLDRELKVIVESLLNALRASGGIDDPEQSFAAGFRALMAAVDDRPDSFRFLVSAEPDPAMSARFTQARAQVTQAATIWIRPAAVRWWHTSDLEHKLPLLIDLFTTLCESAIRTRLADSTEWTSDQVADFFGAAAYRIFSGA